VADTLMFLQHSGKAQPSLFYFPRNLDFIYNSTGEVLHARNDSW
jgi:hypothetical protein